MLTDLSYSTLQRVRHQFSEGAPLPEDLFPSGLAQSWERSRLAGLRSEDKRLKDANVRPSYFASIAQEHSALLSRSRRDMEILWGALKTDNCSILCTNASGLIIDHINSGLNCPADLKSLVCGRLIDERDIGSTAPICALHESTPFVITRNQHYLQELDDFFCAAVPLLDPRGQLLGALDITIIGETPPNWAVQQLGIARASIENSYFYDLEDTHLFQISTDPRLIDSPIQGLVSITGDVLTHANRNAREYLGILNETLLPIPCRSILDDYYTGSLDRCLMDTTHVNTVRLANGRILYIKSCHANRPVTVVSSVSHAPRELQSHAARYAEDAAIDASYRLASRVFAGGVPIVIQGETGTGKEVFAKNLHSAISNAGAFVAINCSAIPKELIEAELFGYVEGAFTGSRKGGTTGKIEQANGGTLFLDEIGDMPLDLQTRLLRVLQERKVTKIGDNRETSVDIKVISASHRDLESLVDEGLFREDLYYRIKGYQVSLPSLRMRSDLQHLVEQLLVNLSPDETKFVATDLMHMMRCYHWPGNIRELEQMLKVGCILSAENSTIRLEHLSPDMQKRLFSSSEGNLGNSSPLRKLEIESIHDTLKRLDGNISATAQTLGISRSTVYKRMRESSR